MQPSILQTDFWCDFKSRHGWQVHQLEELRILERSLPFGLRLLYAPEITLPAKDRKNLISQVKKLAYERHAFFARLEFFEEWSDKSAVQLTKLGLTKSFEEIQPEWRQWIDLTPAENDILAQMKPKGRYNIRLSQRHDVIIQPSSSIDVFYKLLEETAQRDGFGVRSRAYFEDLLTTLQTNRAGELLVAYHHHTPLAALIVSYYQGIASYLYGASSNGHRNLMAPNLLHWETIRRAKQKNCQAYDLLAIGPQADLNNHLTTKYEGLTRFKTQFGGRSVHLLGSWDLVTQPLIYHLFKTAETFRRS